MITSLFVSSDTHKTEQNLCQYFSNGGKLDVVLDYLTKLEIKPFGEKTCKFLNYYRLVIKTGHFLPEIEKVKQIFYSFIEKSKPYAPNLYYHALIRPEYVPLAEVFYEQDYDIDRQEAGTAATALYLCSISKKKTAIDAVKWLLTKKADITIQRLDARKETAFHGSCSTGNIEIIGLLLDKGASINEPSEEGHSPLHFAAPHREALKILMKRGANVHAINTYKHTPLHSICCNTGLSIQAKEPSIEFLLDKGVNIQVKDKNEFQALDYVLRLNPKHFSCMGVLETDQISLPLIKFDFSKIEEKTETDTSNLADRIKKIMAALVFRQKIYYLLESFKRNLVQALTQILQHRNALLQLIDIKAKVPLEKGKKSTYFSDLEALKLYDEPEIKGYFNRFIEIYTPTNILLWLEQQVNGDLKQIKKMELVDYLQNQFPGHKIDHKSSGKVRRSALVKLLVHLGILEYSV